MLHTLEMIGQMTGGRAGQRAALFVSAVVLLGGAACSSRAATAPAASARTPAPPASLRASVPPVSPTTIVAPVPRSDATPIAAAEPAVAIDNFNFTPAMITVRAGATVTWTNRDAVPHTVTAADKSFGSQNIEPAGQFSHAFTRAGTYGYACSIHPFMTAMIKVE